MFSHLRYLDTVVNKNKIPTPRKLPSYHKRNVTDKVWSIAVMAFLYLLALSYNFYCPLILNLGCSHDLLWPVERNKMTVR